MYVFDVNKEFFPLSKEVPQTFCTEPSDMLTDMDTVSCLKYNHSKNVK